jgi:hypothetical protein
MELFRGDKLNHVTIFFVESYFPNVRNLVSSLKRYSGNQNYFSNIFASNIEVITNTFRTIIFQVNNKKKMFIFKMSMHGSVSGFDLVQ